MHPVLQFITGRNAASPWSDTAPVREELFGVERLEQHARSLAAAQQVTARPPSVPSLRKRLRGNAAELLAAYRASAAELVAGRRVVPAAEWLLDNYHVVEEQIREIHVDLPPGYYRLLPKLADGPFAGYPRVFGLAWAYIAHTDSHVDPVVLRRFIAAYQEVQPLDISELWAVAITLRIVLVENLRRLADQIASGRAVRADAQRLSNDLLAPGGAQTALDKDIATRASGPLSEVFAAELAKRLRDQDPRTTPTLQWLDERLRGQGTDTTQVIQHVQQRQGASNVSVRNVITSMRLMSDIDWADLFESVSLVDARLRAGSDFAAMDFPTRNVYRSAIEQLARGSDWSELAIAEQALALTASQAGNTANAGDPGFYLIAGGRPALESTIAFKAPFRVRINRFIVRVDVGGYVTAILALSALVVAAAFWAVAGPGLGAVSFAFLAVLALAAFFPASELVTGLVHRAVTSRFGAVGLPALALTDGVPESLRTLVVIPTLLSTEEDLLTCIEHLEVHHLAGAGGDLSFALLSDGLDADREVVASDAPLIALAQQAIAALNTRHGPAPGGKRFYLLHRRRQFNASENCWMGWERKRGKLHELNRLLRGATDTSFLPLDAAPDASGRPDILSNVRYVITLDADTRLPRDAALRLIGKIAHPLNQVRYSEDQRRVVGGYAILQPRVTPALPLGREGSVYQTLSSGPGGMDPYAAAVSDVYQDLFGEGSYTGKGIYDVDAFEKTLAGRIPENTLLSHDLFEGVFARAGLASDVEVVEEFPARYDVAARRQHRWTRGDWQLLPWLIKRRHAGSTLPPLGRWKMIDNLRRSLLAPASLLALTLCAWLPWPYSLQAMLLVIVAMALPAFLPGLSIRLLPSPNIRPGSHFRLLADGLRMAVLQTLWVVALLPDQAFRALDAIARTLSRLYATHRHLLEWTTAAQAAARPRPGIVGFYGQMAGGVVLALFVTGVAALISPREGLAMLPLLALWLAAPAIAWRASRAPTVAPLGAMDTDDAVALRRIARRTWRFFETFVTPADHMLPPDNFQEDPKPVVARRTSPTNMGLYLLSAVAARDFGWAGAAQTCDRLEATLGSMHKLDRFRGHFYNWYDTGTAQVLLPAYVSAVDSGNLAGHLIALANACEEWVGAPVTDSWTDGADDVLVLAQEAALLLPAVQNGQGKRLLAVLEDIGVSLQGNADTAMPVLQRLADKAVTEARALISAPSANAADLIFWLQALCERLAAQRQDTSVGSLDARWRALASDARAMALGMDFAFLLDPERKLLSIGYNASDNTLDANCYDLLASEARLASLFAIAKGDVETRHWFRLGRTATPVGQGAALVSWSGSMFEYLMPSLIMRAPAGSLLEQTNRLVVQHQIAYGDLLGIPWGISESAYNARDLAFTYQYSNFGVPGLGLKRGLAENTVIAPYASGLATMVDPAAAQRNFERMRQMGALGHYGFYEALDFTRSRLPADASVAIVHNYMAHHQGMTIVAIANTLQGARMRERFHREPMIQACELLLQERLPRLVAVAQVRADDVPSGPVNMRGDLQSVRYLGSATTAEPAVHLLSNGRYAVMLTAAGGGYSRWRDRAVTRWREDVTCDHWGSYVYLREMQSGRVWSASAQPLGEPAEGSEVVFAEDHATFTRRDGNLTTTMEVLVSAEADGEVRRVSVANVGRRVSDVELTSYAEVVLATPSTDDAHPAFAKMFVQTEYLQEFGALIATRRPRTPDEAPMWAAHFAVVEGVAVGDMQYESDRGAFLGRGRNASTAIAMTAGKALSNTLGTVLDPVFSVRQRVRIAPGQVARLAFWTLVAPTREALLDLVDQHHDRSAFERARTLAWTQAQVQLRHIGIEADEAADFQRLAAPILFAEARFRSPADVIARGAGQQSGLWPLSVSGDLPIVLLRIDDIDDIGQVRQLLRAHEYWRMKGLSVDLVIVNERASSYVQDLQVAIDTAVRSSQSRPRLDGEALARGVVHTLRADLMGMEARALLHSVARVVLTARLGPIAQQMAGLPPAAFASQPTVAASALTTSGTTSASKAAVPGPSALTADLECFNGLGGFADNGREYVTVLSDGRTTPAPWINVVANPNFGFQVSADGSSSTWAGNSRENQLTPWSNDPVTDPSGEAFYVRDDASGQIWSPTAQPLRGNGTYVARHGHGYSRFTHESDGIALDLLQFVPLEDPIKISRLTIRNTGRQVRRLTVTSYVEWVLGTARGASAPFILTSVDETTGVLLARNPWSMAFAGRVAFADLGGRQTSRTADRTEFLGRHGRLSSPAALRATAPLSGAAGAGRDPCAALQSSLVLQPGESVTLCALLGQCPSQAESLALVARYRAADLDAVLEAVKEHWRGVLGAVVVHTPDRAMDIMLNGWLLYQTLACRIWARSAFYQSSGAYGFRDQLQDGMALTFARPEETRRHLLRAAGRQFVEGDVQHWWLPDTGQGVRTHISDDRVWLAFATARYVSVSGDAAVLEESIPFLEGPLLKAEEHDAFFQPMQANLSATLFEHCARALDQSIALTGDLDLPLMGTGDWNDGMNRVGQDGKGQSVWLGWLLIRTLDMFMPLAEARDPERVARWRAHREVVRAALEHEAWDGAWYRRATFDDGTWLGSRGSDECRIDSIAQSWAVLSGAADPSRAVTAMNSLDDHLIRRDDGLALLFTPPFDHPVRDPGYIKGYPPGLRENGGQYSHAAMWAIMAYAQLRGDSDSGRAHALFALINPINHARTLEEAAQYRVEPYVVAADVYSVAPHAGRGGWTWYTGAAGWMHRAGVEGILGIRREGDVLIIDPCIPSDWPGFRVDVTLGDAKYAIRVEASGAKGSGVNAAVLDGASVECDDTMLRVAVTPGNHELRVTL